MKKIILISLAILISLSAAVYQRKTGPTYSKEQFIEISNQLINISLPRSHGGDDACIVSLPIHNESMTAKIYFKKYPTNNDYFELPFSQNGENLEVTLPHQPPAGKLAYYFVIFSNEEEVYSNISSPTIIRFKGAVPPFVLIPHILFMFIGMIFVNIAALFAFAKIPTYKFHLNIAFVLLFLGGMIMGPIVQKFAFGEYWAGVPFGWDLTDNKMLIGMIAWSFAFFGNIKKERPIWVVISAIFILVIFSIPHSMYGSELDHKTGQINQGELFFEKQTKQTDIVTILPKRYNQ